MVEQSPPASHRDARGDGEEVNDGVTDAEGDRVVEGLGDGVKEKDAEGGAANWFMQLVVLLISCKQKRWE